MNLEKTVSVTLPSTKGKFAFQRSGENLEIQVIDNEGVVLDSASVSEADLQFLLKDMFPTKRKTRGPNKKTANGNGETRKRPAASATSAAPASGNA